MTAEVEPQKLLPHFSSSEESPRNLRTVFLDDGKEVLDSNGRSALLYNLNMLSGKKKTQAVEEAGEVSEFNIMKAKLAGKANPYLLQDDNRRRDGGKSDEFKTVVRRLCVHEGLLPTLEHDPSQDHQHFRLFPSLLHKRRMDFQRFVTGYTSFRKSDTTSAQRQQPTTAAAAAAAVAAVGTSASKHDLAESGAELSGSGSGYFNALVDDYYIANEGSASKSTEARQREERERDTVHAYLESEMKRQRLVPLTCPHCSLNPDVPPVTQVRPLMDSFWPRAQYKLALTALTEDELDERLWQTLTNMKLPPDDSDAPDSSSSTKKKKGWGDDNSNNIDNNDSDNKEKDNLSLKKKNTSLLVKYGSSKNLLGANSPGDRIAEHFEFRVGAPPWYEFWTRMERSAQELRDRKHANNESAKVRLAALQHEMAVVTAQVKALALGLLEVNPVEKARTLESEEQRAIYECNSYNEACNVIHDQLMHLEDLETRCLQHTAVAVEESRRAASHINDFADFVKHSKELNESHIDLPEVAQLLGDVLASAPVQAKDEQHEAEILANRTNVGNTTTQRFQCKDCLLLCQFSRYCPATGRPHPSIIIPGKEEEDAELARGVIEAQELLEASGVASSQSDHRPLARLFAASASLERQRQKEEALENNVSGFFDTGEGGGGSTTINDLAFSGGGGGEANASAAQSASPFTQGESVADSLGFKFPKRDSVIGEPPAEPLAPLIMSQHERQRVSQEKRSGSMRRTSSFLMVNQTGASSPSPPGHQKQQGPSPSSSPSLQRQSSLKRSVSFEGVDPDQTPNANNNSQNSNSKPESASSPSPQRPQFEVGNRMLGGGVTTPGGGGHSGKRSGASFRKQQKQHSFRRTGGGGGGGGTALAHTWGGEANNSANNNNNSNIGTQYLDVTSTSPSVNASPSPWGGSFSVSQTVSPQGGGGGGGGSAFGESVGAFGESTANLMSSQSPGSVSFSHASGGGSHGRLARSRSWVDATVSITNDAEAEECLSEHVHEVLQCAVRRDIDGMRWHHRRIHRLLTSPDNKHIPRHYAEQLLELEKMFVEWFAAMVNRQREDAKIAAIGAARMSYGSEKSTTLTLRRSVLEDRVRKYQREVRELQYSIAKRPKGRQAGDVDDDSVFEALALRVRNLQRKKGGLRSKIRLANDEFRAIEHRIHALRGELFSPRQFMAASPLRRESMQQPLTPTAAANAAHAATFTAAAAL